MRKIGKISVIKREYTSSQLQTMQSGLAAKGYTRVPGTGVFKVPYKELDGKYRTGLDPDATYIKRINDPLQQELEIKRVTDLRDKLSKALPSLDLSPTSQFWNYSLSNSTSDFSHVQSVKLMDGDNLYDLSVAFQELTFAWLRVHPTIASSYQAWKRGEYPADTQFYVHDEEIETEITFSKKRAINKAIEDFNNMTPEKRRRIARLLGLPVTEDTKDGIVYNTVDDLLKQTEIKTGKYKGLSPVKIFADFANMKEDLIKVKDLVKQAIAHSIYRVKPSGKIYEGEYEVAKDEDDLVKHLIDEDHQDDLITLEGKLKGKKLAAV
jgi:hypothetical protein